MECKYRKIRAREPFKNQVCQVHRKLERGQCQRNEERPLQPQRRSSIIPCGQRSPDHEDARRVKQRERGRKRDGRPRQRHIEDAGCRRIKKAPRRLRRKQGHHGGHHTILIHPPTFPRKLMTFAYIYVTLPAVRSDGLTVVLCPIPSQSPVPRIIDTNILAHVAALRNASYLRHLPVKCD